MQGERRRLKEKVYQLGSLARSHGYCKDILVEMTGEESFERHQAYLEAAID